MDTKLIHTKKKHKTNGPIVTGLIPAVAYVFEDVETAIAAVSGELERPFYGRYENPTTREAEQKIAVLEEAEDALGVSSGMAAISVALLAYVKQGEHVCDRGQHIYDLIFTENNPIRRGCGCVQRYKIFKRSPLSAWDAFLILRGLKSLGLRLRQQLGIDHVLAEVLPEEKGNEVQKLKDQGKKTLIP